VVSVGSGTAKTDRVNATRAQILAAAERLFAEHGVIAVSNRQIGEAAKQGNTAAVGYHFGTKADLVRAIMRKHTEPIERLRLGMLADADAFTGLRDWVACLVRPTAEHLGAVGNPTWFARFSVQVMADPVLREIMIDEALTSPALQQVLIGLNGCLPELAPDVRAERWDMARQLMVHMYAERERALAEGARTPRSSWPDAATGLTDAIVGIWLAPVTSHPSTQENRR
jgi:AcrR family transcriptional regulator